MAIPQITSPPQALAEVIVNQLFAAGSHELVYANAYLTTAGLTWGYYGGRWGGFAIADGTLSLTASSANYLVVAVATGVLSVSTSVTNWSDTANYRRTYKIVTGASAVTSVEDHRAGPSGAHGSGGAASVRQTIAIACSDESTAITAGTAKTTFRLPYAFTLVEARASLTTAQASGSIFTVNIKQNGTTIFSTKITVDNTQKTSKTATTPPVVSSASLSDDAEMTVDVDQVGASGATGLKIYLIGYPT